MTQSKNEGRLQGGKTIGNYVLTRNLGQGTFGKVKLGIHSVTGQKVAVKVLQKSKICDVADVERVTREIHILKQIRHKNLIQLYQIIQTPKQLFLVMEYVSQGQLFQLIVKKKKLKQSQACQFFKQLLAGVQHLHELGVVHRDLKPQNLLIDFDKTLKLVDFGLSNTYKPRQLLKTACGSPCYAAPEMIAGKKYTGLTADIWSCGVILYAMICGYLPFEDPNTTQLYKKITAGDYSIPKFVSPQARDLIQGILTTDPQRRIKLKQIRNHAWYKSNCDNFVSIGLKVGVNLIPVDPLILEMMKQYNQNPEEARKFIQANRHNHSTTIYYLLLKRQYKNGINSEYDLQSSKFNTNLLYKKQKIISEAPTSSQISQSVQINHPINISRGSRIVSRLSQIRQKKPQHIITGDIDFVGFQAHRKNKYNQLDIKKQQFQQPQDQFYQNQPNSVTQKFRQTIAAGFHQFRAPRSTSRHYGRQSRGQSSSNRQSITEKSDKIVLNFQNKGRQSVNQKQRIQKRVQVSTRSNRYRSLDVKKQENMFNKTFMGGFNNVYMPKWSKQSDQIKNILNSTISGHGKRNKNKLQFYF